MLSLKQTILNTITLTLRTFRIPAADRRYRYTFNLPHAVYAPWETDVEFLAIYNVIRSHTLIDIYRCYELWSLVGQLDKANIRGDILEVGVWRGGSGCLLGTAAQSAQRSTFLADTFRGVVKVTARDPVYRGGEYSDTGIELVRDLMGVCKLDGIEILVGVFPEETGHRIADRTFALCHVDVDTYQSAKDTVDWVLPHLTIGGVIVIDDYGSRGCPGMTTLVNEEYAKRSDFFAIHNLNGHALLIRRPEP